MADQVTNIATLPSGYPTLAGALYAVSSTLPRRWSGIAWRKIVSLEETGDVGRRWFAGARRGRTEVVKTACKRLKEKITKEEGRAHDDPDELVKNICAALMKRITKDVRYSAKLPMVEIAAFHVLASTAEWPIHLPPLGGDEEAQGNGGGSRVTSSKRSAPRRPLRRVSCSSSVRCKSISTKVVPHNSDGVVDAASSVEITFADENARERQLELEPEKLHSLAKAQLLESDHKPAQSLRQVIQNVGFDSDQGKITSIIQRAYSTCFAHTIHIQAAASRYAFMLELAFKGIEILVSCAVVLGSTGGAWFGLTIGSLFPEYTAAGVYRSSYGQKVAREQPMGQTQDAKWRAAGTLWTERENDEPIYIVCPVTFPSDGARDTIGYVLQYAALVVVQHFKLRIRAIMQFGDYVYTKDGVRYVLLVIELFIMLTMTIFFQRNTKDRWLSVRGKFALSVYAFTFCCGIATVILGQGPLLKDIWRLYHQADDVPPEIAIGMLYETSKIIDPIVALGTLALMNVTWIDKHGKRLSVDRQVFPEQWILMWALGACTIVW